MPRTIVIDADQARDLSAGGAFVDDRELAINDECELVIRGGSGEITLPARCVYVDPARGAGLEVLGFTAEVRDKLAELSRAEPAELEVLTLDEEPGEQEDAEETTAREREARGTTPLHVRIRGLNLAQQIKLAREGDVQERVLLERIYGKNVWEPLLRNPKLTSPEVARIAKMGTLPRVLLDIIVGNGGWLQMPEVRRCLLQNLRMGTDQITKVLRLMPKPELRLVPTQTVFPMAVREQAKRLLRGY